MKKTSQKPVKSILEGSFGLHTFTPDPVAKPRHEAKIGVSLAIVQATNYGRKTMRKYQISIGAVSYEGMFASSCDAVIDAISRFPDARGVSVRLLEGEQS